MRLVHLFGLTRGFAREKIGPAPFERVEPAEDLDVRCNDIFFEACVKIAAFQCEAVDPFSTSIGGDAFEGGAGGRQAFADGVFQRAVVLQQAGDQICSLKVAECRSIFFLL